MPVAHLKTDHVVTLGPAERQLVVLVVVRSHAVDDQQQAGARSHLAGGRGDVDGALERDFTGAVDPDRLRFRHGGVPAQPG